MGQVEGEAKKPGDVESRDVGVLESIDHHGKNIVMIRRIGFEEAKASIELVAGEVEQVENNEAKQDQSAGYHVAGSEARFQVDFFAVILGARPPVFPGKQNGEEDMQQHGAEEESPDNPENRTEIPQMLGITIDPVGSDENLQIPKQMSDDEKDQNNPRDRDDHFAAHRGVIEEEEPVHVRFRQAA